MNAAFVLCGLLMLPALLLLVFGQVFTRMRAVPTGSLPYIDFMSPGILSQSPTPRSALVIGKALSAGIRGLTRAVIVYLLALLLGVRMDWHPLSLLAPRSSPPSLS